MIYSKVYKCIYRRTMHQITIFLFIILLLQPLSFV